MLRITRLALVLTAAMAMAVVAIAFAQRGPNSPPVALAGPCAWYPVLYPASETPGQLNWLPYIYAYVEPGNDYYGEYFVETYPSVPPQGKPTPYVKVKAAWVRGQYPIYLSLNPRQADQHFETVLTLEVGSNARPGWYHYNIRMVCHPENPVKNDIPVYVYVSSCPRETATPPNEPPAVFSLPLGAPLGSPLPPVCVAPTEAPTPVPTTTPANTQIVITWGDTAPCDEEVNAYDALKWLHYLASLGLGPTPTSAPGECPSEYESLWLEGKGHIVNGDVDCEGSISSDDVLLVLKFAAGIPVDTGECPPPAMPVKVGSFYLHPN